MAAPRKITKITRPASNRGRKALAFPALDAFVLAFAKLSAGDCVLVPGSEGKTSHEDLTLVRYHLKTRMVKAGYVTGKDYTTFAHDDGLGLEKL